MKRKKVILSIVGLLAVIVIGVIMINRPASASVSNAIEETRVSAQGKKCNGTVGCDCTGFKPKTDGKEWEKSYCKKCGHHKRNHK